MPSHPPHLRLVTPSQSAQANSGNGRFAPPAADNPHLIADPIEQLEIDHALQLELCDVLEALADDLPDRVSPSLAEIAASILRKGFPGHMYVEEEYLFPLLRKRVSTDPSLEHVLRQLEHEHEDDEEFASELAEELESIALGRKVSNPDMLGYMLRGFFVSQRRHIEWENATIIPLARQFLQSSDYAELRFAFRQNSTLNARRKILAKVEKTRCEDCRNPSCASKSLDFGPGPEPDGTETG